MFYFVEDQRHLNILRDNITVNVITSKIFPFVEKVVVPLITCGVESYGNQN